VFPAYAEVASGSASLGEEPMFFLGQWVPVSPFICEENFLGNRIILRRMNTTAWNS
jgi:hypothetical protein